MDSYVGVIETPCGTQLEILPKHTQRLDCVEETRDLLQRMIQAALKLPTREVGAANLKLFNVPLSEWVIRQFLKGLDYLIKRGIRFDYQRVEEEQRFLRGQLNVTAQMRQPPGRQHRFQIRHDVFLPNRPENRLLRLALERVCKCTNEPENWRLAHELRGVLTEVPPSINQREDFKSWRNEQLMAHYQPIRPWCELVLGERSPMSVSGDWQGISLLFPMEKLFEQYVEVLLRTQLSQGAQLLPQRARHSLCTYDNTPIFRLKPDFLLEHDQRTWVIDAKWKLVDSSDRSKKYGLAQADFYQLFAYGQTYLKGKGEMVLIYPKTETFSSAFDKPFIYSGELKLWVLPIDLVRGKLSGSDLVNLPLTMSCENK